MPPAWIEAAGGGGQEGIKPDSARFSDFEKTDRNICNTTWVFETAIMNRRGILFPKIGSRAVRARERLK